MTDTFATRLNEQAFRWERENFQRLTNKELSDWLAESGCEVSKTYLSQLRSGARTNPSIRLMEHLVGFFGVAPDYFTAPRANAPDRDNAVVDRIDMRPLRRLARTAVELSPEALEYLIAVADRFRVAEGCLPTEHSAEL